MSAESERARRWRLVLGPEADPASPPGTGGALRLTGDDARMDRALSALYGGSGGREGAGGAGGGRAGSTARRRSAAGPTGPAGPGTSAAPAAPRVPGGLGGSSPQVARWLGDIRRYFPTDVVQVMQRDAIDRLGLERLLLEPETLAAVEPDVHLVGTLLSLARALPETSRETARAVVRRVVADLERRLAARTRTLVGGALDRSARTSRPRGPDVDWDRTIRANLARGNYLPEARAVVPERLVGHARAGWGLGKELVLCVDRSGSMAASVVHASVFASVLASVRALRTRLVLFDTSVVDLTESLGEGRTDPVDLLFGIQLGGGTDLGRALAYCAPLVSRPSETVFVLISDLGEGSGGAGGSSGAGGSAGGGAAGAEPAPWLRRMAALRASGAVCVALLALSDDGAPAYDRENAAALAALGVPAFACTPDVFPEVLAEALEGRIPRAPASTRPLGGPDLAPG